jgi:hypothetical protein
MTTTGAHPVSMVAPHVAHPVTTAARHRPAGHPVTTGAGTESRSGAHPVTLTGGRTGAWIGTGAAGTGSGSGAAATGTEGSEGWTGTGSATGRSARGRCHQAAGESQGGCLLRHHRLALLPARCCTSSVNANLTISQSACMPPRWLCASCCVCIFYSSGCVLLNMTTSQIFG